MNNARIAIVDCGIGNVWSAYNAARLYAPNTVVTEESEVVAAADAIILPGVGTFAAGMEGLRKRGMIEVIRAAAQKGTPILGICLGAQLLMDRGFEFGETEGLQIIGGEVRHFPDLSPLRVPNIGWREVKPTHNAGANLLFADAPEHSQYYFVHSYELRPSDESAVLATTRYGEYDYCAAIGKGRVFGVQFHPEKSGPRGLAVIKNFIQTISIP